MEIACFHAEEQSSEKAEHGVAEVAMQKWHGSRRYPALKSVAHGDVVTFAELCHESSRCDRS